MILNAILLGFFTSYLTNFPMLFSGDGVINIRSGFSIETLKILTFVYALIFIPLFYVFIRILVRKVSKNTKEWFTGFLQKSLFSLSFLATAISTYLFLKSKMLFESGTVGHRIYPIQFNWNIIGAFLLIVLPVTFLIQYLLLKRKYDGRFIFISVLLPELCFFVFLIMLSQIVGFFIGLGAGIAYTLTHGF